ncbi:MAG: segregation/condensation protein A, partial [Chitinophagales bacterium]
ERDELDIYDIPISKITADFLDYIHQMETMNIEVASEFILVASSLMRIKAKMLLPRKEVDEEGNELDPREELVQKLLEYKKFKAVIDDLKTLEENRTKIFQRGNIQSELKYINHHSDDTAELHTLDLYKLMQAFNKVLNRFEDRKQNVQHTIIRYNYSISSQKEYLLGILNPGEPAGFETIFQICEDRIHALFTFLALLELIQLGNISIQLRDGINNFTVELKNADQKELANQNK